MRKSISLFLVLFASISLIAQPTLPSLSPAASLKATVGVTDISIDYSAPGARERKVFGGLVPFGQLWRTGANMATKVTFSTNVTIGGKLVKAGTYALFSIPNSKSWTFILNSNFNQGGTDSYKDSLDVARVESKPSDAPFMERLTFFVTAKNESTATITLYWEKTMVSFDVYMDTKGMVNESMAAFEKKEFANWMTLANMAKFNVDNGLDLDKANKWCQLSLVMRDHFYNKWMYAQVLAKQNKKKEAKAMAMEAMAFGTKNPSSFYDAYKEEIEKAAKTW